METTVDTTTNTAVAAGSALGAFLATMGIFALVIGIAWYILQVIAYWKIFVKAGKPGYELEPHHGLGHDRLYDPRFCFYFQRSYGQC